MAALFAAVAAVTVTFTVPGWRTSVLTWAVTVVVVLVWACWAWPDAGMMCSSATAVSVLLLVEVRYLTPPWLPGGFDWVLTFSYVSLAWLAVLSALTMRNRRGRRVWTAGIYQVCLLVLPVFAPIAPGPSIAGALVVFVLWYGWRGGIGRMPALLWNLRTAQKMRRLNVAAVNDSPPQWWPQLPARWVSLHNRRAGWSRGSQPVPHLVVGVFGAVVVVHTPAGSTGSVGVPAAARTAARAVDAVEWALKTPPHMVHAVVVTDNPDQDEVWVKSVHSVGHPRTPIAVTDTKHLVATIRTVRAPHAHTRGPIAVTDSKHPAAAIRAARRRIQNSRAGRLNRRFETVAKTLPAVADLMLPYDKPTQKMLTHGRIDQTRHGQDPATTQERLIVR